MKHEDYRKLFSPQNKRAFSLRKCFLLLLLTKCHIVFTLFIGNGMFTYCVIYLSAHIILILNIIFSCFSISSLLCSFILSLVFHSLEHILICKYGFLLNLCFLFIFLFWLWICKYDASFIFFLFLFCLSWFWFCSCLSLEL